MDYIDLDDLVRLGGGEDNRKRAETLESSPQRNTEFRVLVVDDSAVMRRVLQEALLASGYPVETCNSGEEACEIIANRRPHIVISDWQMPGMDGAELCQWIREQSFDRYIYFLMVTAHDEFFGAGAGMRSGVDEFIRKPLRTDELLARLQNGQKVLALHQRLQSPAETGSYEID